VRPIVALLSDFGTRDHFVGSMKGAVLAACPDVALVDITHHVAPHAVAEAARSLQAAYRAFPGGSVFLVVVDPGVGTARRGLAIEAGGYRFVGPDNGVFSRVLDAHPAHRLHALTNTALHRHSVSPTFHGRDVFAPVAGLLAHGLPLETVGEAATDPVRLPVMGASPAASGGWEGPVGHVDRFGNLSTEIDAATVDLVLAEVEGDPSEVVVWVAGRQVPLVRTFGDVAPGEACALLGSSGWLEVALNQGHAAEELGVSLGDLVRLAPLAPRGGPE